ncbi:MAG: GNAT family N-acetyltransferase [Clostridiales bacterium]|jgi:predicted acetyltransferase|nr:GNAT family N-acetyltransferase [Clostridiales bacterium]
MLQVKTATMADKARIRELWKLCFGDSEQFMDWFFSERYFPAYSSCLLEDGVIMSALQSYPLHVRMRGAVVMASMLAGVSTHPERNGRGYMKRIFLHYMQRVRNSGIPIAIHTPAHLPTFFSRGHYPATDTLYLTIENANCARKPGEIAAQSLYEDLAPLLLCYQKATAGYSGVVSRTMGDFMYKMRDYGADNGKCLVRRVNGNAPGYCVYYAMPDMLHAEECFALDTGTLSMLIDALRHKAGGRKLYMKLPPDARVELRGSTSETRPQGVMGIANVSTMLEKIIGNAEYVFEVTDASVPQNAGVWDGCGKASRREPHIRLEAGRLGQFLCGYRSIADLAAANEAQIKNEAMAEALDSAYPRQVCFITDEY